VRRLRLRYAGACALCETELPKDTLALYDPMTRTVRGLAELLLVAYDVGQFCKQHDIPLAPRGSGDQQSGRLGAGPGRAVPAGPLPGRAAVRPSGPRRSSGPGPGGLQPALAGGECLYRPVWKRATLPRGKPPQWRTPASRNPSPGDQRQLRRAPGGALGRNRAWCRSDSDQQPGKTGAPPVQSRRS